MRHHALLAVVKRFVAPLLLFSFLASNSCGSQIPRIKKLNLTDSQELNLDLISFEDLATGEAVTLSEYMDTHNKDFLLLMFGSVGCGICNQKARELAANFEGKHSLLVAKDQKRFDLIGINTDTGAARTRFNGIMLNDSKRSEYGYDFIKWNDAKGETMQAFFLPPKEAFGVPFATLISRRNLMWRYNNKDHYTLQELLDRAEQTIAGEDPGSSGNSVENRAERVDDSTRELQFESPSRFRQLSVTSCDGISANLQELVNEVDMTFIQVSREACADRSDCGYNFDQFKSLESKCEDTDSYGTTCRFVTLTTEVPDRARCAEGGIYRGGDEFLQTFRSHFDWNYLPTSDDYGTPSGIPSVKGPIVLGFNKDGSLFYSWEGPLPDKTSPTSIKAAIERGGSGRAKGADFQTYDGSELVNFSELTQRSKFTVFTAFDRLCGSCLEELAHWSGAAVKKDDESLLSFCEKDPDFCQVIALEAELARPNTAQGRDDFYHEIVNNYFKPNGIRVPLFLDVNSFNDYGRIFESYLTNTHPNWDGVYGTVVYDREGKILKDFKSEGPKTPDPVLTTLKIYKSKGR
jgi:hypothetical protein